jgi:surface antigen
MRPIEPALNDKTRRRGADRPSVFGACVATPGRRRALLAAALVLASLPAASAGWVMLLSKTAAEKFQEEDLRMFLEAARDALNAEGPPKTVEWSNPANSTGGSFLVIGDSVRNGMPCRRLRFSTYAPGYPNPPKGSTTWTACKAADGKWKLAEAK